MIFEFFFSKLDNNHNDQKCCFIKILIQEMNDFYITVSMTNSNAFYMSDIFKNTNKKRFNNFANLIY